LLSRAIDRGLSLAGGYLEIAFSEPGELSGELDRLDQLLDTFDSVKDGGVPPRPTLADAGSGARRRHPGRSQADPSLGWDEQGWDRFADSLARVAERCRKRGYEPTFHPHTATYLEAPWEIDRMLALTDVGVCLDTGHLLLGGGDPVRAVEVWGERINHVHLKDARLDVIGEIVREGAPVEAIWERQAFCRLGAGDVQIDTVLESLSARGYQGWLVVEQDILPDPEHPRQPVEDQRLNREYLRARGL
jgi:inosose dehydratase